MNVVAIRTIEPPRINDREVLASIFGSNYRKPVWGKCMFAPAS